MIVCLYGGILMSNANDFVIENGTLVKYKGSDEDVCLFHRTFLIDFDAAKVSQINEMTIKSIWTNRWLENCLSG